MKLLLSAMGFVVLLLASCGLETVNTLPQPILAPNYLNQVSGHTLTFTDSADYTGTNFLGYEVFYKIYNVGLGFANISNDISSLANYPTRDYLVNSLGYHRFNIAKSSLSPEPILPLGSSVHSGPTVALDFSSFISNIPNGATYSGGPFDDYSFFPTLSFAVGGVTQTTENLRRGIVKWNSVYTNFYNIAFTSQNTPSGFQLDADMAPTTVSGPYEIDVFVVSYAWSPDTGPTYSQPVAWGVISDTSFLKWYQ